MTDISTLLQLALLFGRLSLLSFGGGTTVLGEMEREVVGHGWLTHDQFVQSYALGQLTPGPGMTLVVPIGYQTAGIAGGLVAFLSFFLPTAILALAVVAVWSRVRESKWPKAIRTSTLPVASGLTLASAYTISMGSIHSLLTVVIALATMALIMRSKIPTPVVLLASGAVGALFIRG